MKTLTQGALTILCFAVANNVFGDCGFSSGDEVCDYWTNAQCPNTADCTNKECLGRNFGEEIMLVPGGKYPDIWITETDGDFFEAGGFDCGVTSNPGVTILDIGDFGHCVVGLQTDEHMYLEFFASSPELECYGWVECQCD